MKENLLEKAKADLFEYGGIEGCDLLIFCVGPLSQKLRPERVSALCGRLKRGLGVSLKLIFCDSPALDIPPEVYKRIIRARGVHEGLFEDDVAFTSDIGFPEELSDSCLDMLFALSDIYVSPARADEKNISCACLHGNLPIFFEGEYDGAYVNSLHGYTACENGDFSELFSLIKGDSRVGVKKHLRKSLAYREST